MGYLSRHATTAAGVTVFASAPETGCSHLPAARGAVIVLLGGPSGAIRRTVRATHFTVAAPLPIAPQTQKRPFP